MIPQFNNRGLNLLHESLKATSVLSKDYAANVIGWALIAVEEAHENGRARARQSIEAEVRRQAALAPFESDTRRALVNLADRISAGDVR